ncbi:uncharacterized protein PITG_14570 [Phytophthora infestans T30-4]|uniref:Uncharacterized protein n=1 Tax=Phytophthora infestans (strain T30-4) TaxID=403677 RepID=D0NQK2_PHYIT|nr:uncharacterized protein PITG_14570 [Phytophthora infestans T30-4]EEY62950.1 conserved hypothetical protein [Phytophthora infestans T30-4]|eukprot:XP_002898473.1 conserved hypothetical protein [Phytophthora infestans T30-4]
MYKHVLEQWARQPAPSEGTTPERKTAGSLLDASVMDSGGRREVGFALDRTRPSLQPMDDSRRDVPLVTSVYEQPNNNVPGQQGSRRAPGAVHVVAGTPTRAYVPGGSRGATPVQSMRTPTRGSGTPTTDPALQALIMDGLAQLLQRAGVTNGTPVPSPRPQATGHVPSTVPTPTRPMTSSVMGYQGPMTPRMRDQTPVSTPSRMPMPLFFRMGACQFLWLIPRETVEVVERPNGWAAAGAIPAWSAASARQTPASPRSGTYGLPFQRTSPMNVATFQGRSGALGQEGNVGAKGGRYAPNAVPPQGQVTSPYYDQGVRNGSHGSGRGAQQDVPIVGIPTELRNAVKVIVASYSETATYEMAAAFWRSFEKCTLSSITRTQCYHCNELLFLLPDSLGKSYSLCACCAVCP